MRLRAGSSQSGFTLVEIMAVIFIVGLMMGIVVPALDNMGPGTSLRAKAQDISSSIELMRGTAIGQGRPTGIAYDLDGGRYRLFRTSLEDPLKLEPFGRVRQLGRFVKFRGIQPQGIRYQTSGELRVRFDPTGIDGSHIIHLENTRGQVYSVKYNALTGRASVVRGEAVFEEAKP